VKSDDQKPRSRSSVNESKPRASSRYNHFILFYIY